jgi:hypothetical protein
MAFNIKRNNKRLPSSNGQTNDTSSTGTENIVATRKWVQDLYNSLLNNMRTYFATQGM